MTDCITGDETPETPEMGMGMGMGQLMAGSRERKFDVMMCHFHLII
jgi:hypothetical protein